MNVGLKRIHWTNAVASTQNPPTTDALRPNTAFYETRARPTLTIIYISQPECQRMPRTPLPLETGRRSQGAGGASDHASNMPCADITRMLCGSE